MRNVISQIVSAVAKTEGITLNAITYDGDLVTFDLRCSKAQSADQSEEDEAVEKWFAEEATRYRLARVRT